MNFLDRIFVGSYIRRSREGYRIFFPFTYLGSGYIIRSNEEYQRLLRNYRILHIIVLPLAFIAGLLIAGNTIQMLEGLLFFITFLVVYVIFARLQCAKLERTDQYVYTTNGKPGSGKLKSFFNKSGKYVELFLIIFCVITTIILITIGSSIENILVPVISLVTMISGMLTRIYLERYRIKRMKGVENQEQNKDPASENKI